MAGVDDDEVMELRCGGGRDEPGAYAAELKRKLDLYCAAVAKSMEAKSQESSLGYPNSQASGTSQLISQASFDGGTSQLISQASFDGYGDGASLVTNSTAIGHHDFRGKPANSGASKEQSDGGGSLEEQTDPANAKKMRRMLLNRQSARRSRKRRQTHMCDLESQVSRLTSDNASLLKRLADMTQKYKDATLHNRNLIVDAETMRTKVNIAEEAVRRLTETAVLLSSRSEMPPNIMTLTSAVAIEDSTKYFLREPLEDDQNRPGFGFPKQIPLTSGDGHHASHSVMRSMLGDTAEEDL